jgi:hypothetical protein
MRYNQLTTESLSEFTRSLGDLLRRGSFAYIGNQYDGPHVLVDACNLRSVTLATSGHTQRISVKENNYGRRDEFFVVTVDASNAVSVMPFQGSLRSYRDIGYIFRTRTLEVMAKPVGIPKGIDRFYFFSH